MREDITRLVESCTNEGRWGNDDELGTLNLITPEVRRRAATLVRTGESVSLASDLTLSAGPTSDSLTGHTAYTDPVAPIAVVDDVSLHVHGWSTHLDAIGHVYLDGVGYNGRRRSEVVTDQGLRANSITAMRDGIFTSGVLLDVAAARGGAWLAPDAEVTVADLESAEARAKVSVRSGDAVLVHTGLSARLAEGVGADEPARRAGLGVEAVLWLRARDVAVFGGDCVDVLPGMDPDLAFPLHQLGIARMGLTLLDWPRLDRLVDTCRRLDRSDFLLTVAPLLLVAGTGSPVNPIATF